MGIGTADGKNRAHDAAVAAVSSPLIDPHTLTLTQPLAPALTLTPTLTLALTLTLTLTLALTLTPTVILILALALTRTPTQVSSPLIDFPIAQAKGIVLTITGSSDMTLQEGSPQPPPHPNPPNPSPRTATLQEVNAAAPNPNPNPNPNQEVNAAAQAVFEMSDPDANIIFGAQPRLYPEPQPSPTPNPDPTTPTPTPDPIPIPNPNPNQVRRSTTTWAASSVSPWSPRASRSKSRARTTATSPHYLRPTPRELPCLSEHRAAARRGAANGISYGYGWLGFSLGNEAGRAAAGGPSGPAPRDRAQSSVSPRTSLASHEG